MAGALSPGEAVAERPGVIRLPGGAAVCWTTRHHGDLGPREPASAATLATLAGRPVIRLRQVHSGRVVIVEGPGAPADQEGDALVTTSAAVGLAISTADCAPVALAAAEGVVAAVHAGWRGLMAGVLEAAVEQMRALGATYVQAALGPCIHAECYEFAPAELEEVTARFGARVEGRTAGGRAALDLPAVVRVALAGVGVELVHDERICTACAVDRCFSHRARREAERHAMVVWKA